MITRIQRLLATLIAALGLALASATGAWAGSGQYADHYGPLYAGYDMPAFASFWVWDGWYINGWSTGSAYSGVWFVNSSQQRVSADAWCDYAPGCTAEYSWGGPYPDGYPIVHNHGNASPSYFNGVVYWV